MTRRRARFLWVGGFLGLAYVASGQTPTLTSLSPGSVAAGSGAFTLSLSGSNFPTNATVEWNTMLLATTFVNSGELTASVPASLVANPGTALIAVTGASGSLQFSVVSNPLLVSTASLPNGTVGQAYSSTLSASGGTAPYHWSGQNLPTGLSIDPSTGILSGIPSALGSSTFTIQVTDSASSPATAARSFTVTFTAPGLTINTLSPLPNGAVTTAYSQTLAASGGTPPYTWSIASGSVPGLSLGASTGILQGTLTTAGTFSLTIRVTDSAGQQATQNYSLTVNAPTLTIIATATPPNGDVGVAYPSQMFSAVGTQPYVATPPYSWIASGVPGLTIDSKGTLSGTPTTAGSFSLTVQATDAKGATGTRTFMINIIAGLRITTASQLPDATLGSAFSVTMAATGGTPPYTWAANGLPSGVSINAKTGAISGTLGSAGPISFTVTVVDATQATASSLFHINVKPLPLPSISITDLPNPVAAAQQYSIRLTLADAYPSADISGTVTLTSAPADNGPIDGSLQFSSGGRSANFTIAGGSTSATLLIQVGTVAGTINVAVTQVLVGGFDVTPSPEPQASTQIAAAAPVITSATASLNGSTLSIRIAGYATSREVTQATFNFAAAVGQTLATSQFSIPVDSIFGPYYQNPANAAYGTLFIFTQPFMIHGNANAVIPQSVTLANRIGATTAPVTQ